MSSNETDEEILVSYLAGDTEEFKKLIDKYTSPLYNFSARLTGKENADDIVQEIFIKIWKNVKKFDPTKASFKTWIFTIAKNTTTDFLRKKKNISFSDLEKYDEDGSFADTIESEEILPLEALQKLEDVKILNKLLDQLRPNYKEVLILHYQEDMTFSDIGKILKKPLNTVKSDHRRAIIELRKMLE